MKSVKPHRNLCCIHYVTNDVFIVYTNFLHTGTEGEFLELQGTECEADHLCYLVTSIRICLCFHAPICLNDTMYRYIQLSTHYHTTKNNKSFMVKNVFAKQLSDQLTS
jgi:hypothetical protein